MTEKENDSTKFVNDPDHYDAYGDYIRAWYKENIGNKREAVKKPSTNTLAKMSREQLLDTIDNAYDNLAALDHHLQKVLTTFANYADKHSKRRSKTTTTITVGSIRGGSSRQDSDWSDYLTDFAIGAAGGAIGSEVVDWFTEE